MMKTKSTLKVVANLASTCFDVINTAGPFAGFTVESFFTLADAEKFIRDSEREK